MDRDLGTKTEGRKKAERASIPDLCYDAFLLAVLHTEKTSAAN
jgi:hypothetical protein